MTARSWTLTIDTLGRCHTSNDERRKHWRALTGIHKAWRDTAAKTAMATRFPRRLPPCTVTAYGRYQSGNLPDAGAIAPTVKCVLDGLVDHGCWPDDSGEWIRGETYLPPVLDRTAPHALIVTLHPVSDAGVLEGQT